MLKAVKGRTIQLDIDLQDYYPLDSDIVIVYFYGKFTNVFNNPIVDGTVLRLAWRPLTTGAYSLSVNITSKKGEKLWGSLPAFVNVVSFTTLEEGEDPGRLLKVSMNLKDWSDRRQLNRVTEGKRRHQSGAR